MSKNQMNNSVFNLIYNSLFDSSTIAFVNKLLTNGAFSKHLAKETCSMPPEYDDHVRKILCVLHEMKLREMGDELDHIKHISTILSNELLPLKDLPVFYLKEIKKANIAVLNDILSKCKDSFELPQIKKLLFSINHIEGEDIVGVIGGDSDSQYEETSV